MDCVVYPQMKWQFDNSGLPKSKYKPIRLTPQSCDKNAFKQLADIRKNIDQFVKEGKNLYICSTTPGNGKTSWAIKMLQTYFHYVAEGNLFNVKGMFISVANLLIKMKDFDNPLLAEFKENLQTTDLLILDDIAVTGLSQFDYLQLFTLIDNRMLANKSIIFTSNNVTLEDLEKSVGARLASRVWRNSTIIELRGDDRRG
jgi:DNA replication protein DnaC